MNLEERMPEEELQDWIKKLMDAAMAQEMQGGPLLDTLIGVSWLSVLLQAAVEDYFEDLGLPRDIDELVLVNRCLSDENSGYPLYTVQVQTPEHNVEMFIKDVECDGLFEVYSAWGLDGSCFPPCSCMACKTILAELA